jgi:hypothetical protein
MRGLLIVMAVLLVSTSAALAQDTPTPTPTNTPTPDVVQVWALPTQVNAEGTPEPIQYAAFAYTMDAGQVAITFFLAILVFSIWAMFIITLLIRQKESQP